MNIHLHHYHLFSLFLIIFSIGSANSSMIFQIGKSHSRVAPSSSTRSSSYSYNDGSSRHSHRQTSNRKRAVKKTHYKPSYKDRIMSFVGRDSIDEQKRKTEYTCLEAMIAAIPWSIKEMMESPENQYITLQTLRMKILDFHTSAWFRIKDNPKLTKSDQSQLYSYLANVIENQFEHITPKINEEPVHIQLHQQQSDDDSYINAKSYIKKKSGKTPKGTQKAVLTIQGKKKDDAEENDGVSSSFDSTAEESSSNSSDSSVSSLSRKNPKICPIDSNDSSGSGSYIERNAHQHQLDEEDDLIFFEDAKDSVYRGHNHEGKDESDLDLDAEVDSRLQNKPLQKKKGLKMEGSFFTTSRNRSSRYKS